MEDLQTLEVILAFPSIASLKLINVQKYHSMSVKMFNIIPEFCNWKILQLNYLPQLGKTQKWICQDQLESNDLGKTFEFHAQPKTNP